MQIETGIIALADVFESAIEADDKEQLVRYYRFIGLR